MAIRFEPTVRNKTDVNIFTIPMDFMIKNELKEQWIDKIITDRWSVAYTTHRTASRDPTHTTSRSARTSYYFILFSFLLSFSPFDFSKGIIQAESRHGIKEPWNENGMNFLLYPISFPFKKKEKRKKERKKDRRLVSETRREPAVTMANEQISLLASFFSHSFQS